MGIWLLIDYSYQLWTLNIDHNLCYFVAEYAVFMQKMLFVAVLLCDFYANCVDIIQGDFFNWPPPKNHKFKKK